MKRKVLVVSHADADGHVIAEQSRRNLAHVRSFDVHAVVDPERTKDHRAWLRLKEITEIEDSDIVCFVDLMFAPASFGAEADALVRFARERPKKQFFVFDHHPLPLRRLSASPNIRAMYFPDVFDCTVGPSSPMMIIAALCESQQSRVKVRNAEPIETVKGDEISKKPVDEVIAKGVKRAAALGGALPGAKLAALLRNNCWNELRTLGEDKAKHALPRGRRRQGEEPSKVLSDLDKLATNLLKKTPSAKSTGHKAMSYDFEHATDRAAPVIDRFIPQPKDLEAIVTLLQLAAIELTPSTGTEFTAEQLVAKARELGGDEVQIELSDIEIVLGKAGFLKKHGKKLVLK